MWLNQRRAWRNLAGGGTPTATNIATSACDGTYLGGTEGKERRKVVGAGNEGKGGACRILENTILWTFNLPLNVAPFCEVIIQGPEASIWFQVAKSHGSLSVYRKPRGDCLTEHAQFIAQSCTCGWGSCIPGCAAHGVCTKFIDPSVAMYNTLYSDRILLRQRLQNTVRKQLNSPTLRQIKKRAIPPSWDVGRDPR